MKRDDFLDRFSGGFVISDERGISHWMVETNLRAYEKDAEAKGVSTLDLLLKRGEKRKVSSDIIQYCFDKGEKITDRDNALNYMKGLVVAITGSRVEMEKEYGRQGVSDEIFKLSLLMDHVKDKPENFERLLSDDKLLKEYGRSIKLAFLVAEDVSGDKSIMQHYYDVLARKKAATQKDYLQDKIDFLRNAVKEVDLDVQRGLVREGETGDSNTGEVNEGIARVRTEFAKELMLAHKKEKNK